MFFSALGCLVVFSLFFFNMLKSRGFVFSLVLLIHYVMFSDGCLRERRNCPRFLIYNRTFFLTHQGKSNVTWRESLCLVAIQCFMILKQAMFFDKKLL